MASKKSTGPARGATLVKKAIEAAGTTIATPEPVEAAILKKLRLPNDEKLSAGLKTFLAHDASLLGWSFDDEEPEFEVMSLGEIVEQEFGEEAVPAFGEAAELLDGDCVLIAGEGDARSFLYVGTPDDLGEYPIITISHGATAAVFGFVPFDVWIAQRLGVLARSDTPGWLPEEYAPTAAALAAVNGDGRVSYASEHRDVEADDDDEDEENGDEATA
ncbi:MAG: hypothetical protein ACHREM_10295 [Polyangiales bacterium]